LGELLATIPSHAIATANREVEIVQSRFSDKQKQKRKFKKNNIFDEKLQAQMGKVTCDVGATEAARKFSAKLGVRLNESTMRGIKNAYVTEQNRKQKRGEDDLKITNLLVKKQGRPLLLGKNLDVAVQEYGLKLREVGCPVNTDVTIAAAQGILQAMEASRLAKNGGPATLSVSWAKSLLKRMDFRKRRGTTKSGVTPEDLDSFKKTLFSEMVETVDINDIPGELTFNWELTWYLELCGLWINKGKNVLIL